MNITNHMFFPSISSVKKMNNTITPRQQKIMLIATCALCMFAALFLIARRYSAKMLSSSTTNKSIPQPGKIDYKKLSRNNVEDIGQEKLIEKETHLHNIDKVEAKSSSFQKDDDQIELGKSIHLYGCRDLTAQDLKQLPEDLEELNLNQSDIPPIAIPFLPRNLKILNLANHSTLCDNDLEHLPPNLEELDLSFCLHLTSNALEKLPRSIKRLKLHGCNNLTEVNSIDKLPQDLTELSFEYCKQLTDDAVQNFPKKLRKLNLRDCEKLTDKALHFLNSNSYLEKLELSGNSNFTDDAIKNLNINLSELYLNKCNFTDEAFKNLPLSINKISILNCPKISNDALSVLKNSHFSEISISFFKNLLDSSIIKELKKVGKLELYNLKEANIEGLSEDLEELKIVWDWGFQNPITIHDLPQKLKRLTFNFLNSDCTFKTFLPSTLEELTIRGDKTFDLNTIPLPSNLKKFELNSCLDITPNMIKKLPRSLEKLTLKNCKQLSDESLKDLPPNLRVLELQDCALLTDNSIKNLPISLETLELENCPNLTASIFDNLHQNLSYLRLLDCQNLTDPDLSSLSKKLKWLDMQGCPKVTLPPHINFTALKLKQLSSASASS